MDRAKLVMNLKPFTKISVARMENLFNLCHEVNENKIPGVFVECGVHKGGAAVLMALNSLDRITWMFDSFEGMPVPTKEDGPEAPKWTGKTVAGLHHVKSLLWDYQVPKEKVRIIKGWFKDTVPKTNIDKIAILRLDGDWYESTKICLEHLYDKVSPGGYIIIDDYGHWQGCKKAVDEFIKKKGLNIELNKTDYTERWWKK